ncbi:hypothetical protein VNO77_03362 [Canavalia gladiata]|uniref:Uncharacterized protein n=1 Tax=Canavalia gladiata TaxID=3824 RepID=A0AAN9MZR2_CANGL
MLYSFHVKPPTCFHPLPYQVCSRYSSSIKSNVASFDSYVATACTSAIISTVKIDSSHGQRLLRESSDIAGGYKGASFCLCYVHTIKGCRTFDFPLSSLDNLPELYPYGTRYAQCRVDSCARTRIIRGGDACFFIILTLQASLSRSEHWVQFWHGIYSPLLCSINIWLVSFIEAPSYLQAELVGEARDLLATLTCHGYKLVFDSGDSYNTWIAVRELAIMEIDAHFFSSTLESEYLGEIGLFYRKKKIPEHGAKSLLGSTQPERSRELQEM